MAIPINDHSQGINNPTETENLSLVRDFILQDGLETLVMVNLSEEEVTVLVKGVDRDHTDLPAYGKIDITAGYPITILPGNVATITLALMYKHFGESGDTIQVSSSSVEKERVICWLCE